MQSACKEETMESIFANVEVGRKNIAFGIALFLVFGAMGGIPLTINMFGGSVLTSEQYQTWKVIHGYGVFLAFINYFFGLTIDRLQLTRRQKQACSWSFLLAGLCGAVIRMTLVLLSAFTSFGLYASLGESMFFVIGTIIFVVGQVHSSTSRAIKPRPTDYSLRGQGQMS
jgi:hypothetical protein